MFKLSSKSQMKHRAARNSKKFNNGDLNPDLAENESEKPIRVFKPSQIKSIGSNNGTPNESSRVKPPKPEIGPTENILKSQQYQNK